MRILFLASGYYRVGDYFRFRALAAALVQLGHHVSVLTSDTGVRLRATRRTTSGGEWIHVPYLGGLRLAERLSDYLPETKIPYDVAYRSAFALRHATDYDVIHVFHPGYNTLLPLLAARLRHGRALLVYDSCDLWEGGIIEAPESGWCKRIDYRLSVAADRKAFTGADAVTVNTTFMKRRATDLGVAADDVLIVQDGADTDKVRPIDRDVARTRIGLPAGPGLVLGFSGFFHPDSVVMLRSVAEVRRSYDVKLLLIGTVPERLHQSISDLGLTGHVVTTGPVDDLSPYLGACDILLLPFSNRPVNLGRWPIKTGDYLAAGRPVVAGAHGDVGTFFAENPDIGAAGDFGVESFAGLITDLIEDPDRRARAGLAARRVAEQKLDWLVRAKSVERFYSGRITFRRRTPACRAD